jgi:chorismate mutase
MFKLNIVPINSWLNNSQKPLVIAGPCSAETEEQVIKTAKQIATKYDISALRAGIWKPRTRPNAFEGVGEEALKWLVKAGKEINKPVITEVANAQHVEKALKAGVDMLWLGARTTVNPFFVQEIADALDGINIPVLVKNPINPDVQLWIGALERLNKVGITKLAAVHRGFSSFEKSVYRNVPMWEIPIQLKSTFPELEIFCDPSHITGNASLIGEVCQQALNLGFSGLMIESHIDPANAKSDKEQQLTPSVLAEVLKSLTPKQVHSSNLQFQNKLEELRLKIDEVDNALLKKLAERIELVAEIGNYKKENDVAILQIERWQQILDSRENWGKLLDLHPEFVKLLLEVVHQESIKIQTAIMNNQVEVVDKK